METETKSQRKHIWPWFVLAIFVVGVVLTVLWVSAEVKRTGERRQNVFPQTPASSPSR